MGYCYNLAQLILLQVIDGDSVFFGTPKIETLIGCNVDEALDCHSGQAPPGCTDLDNTWPTQFCYCDDRDLCNGSGNKYSFAGQLGTIFVIVAVSRMI